MNIWNLGKKVLAVGLLSIIWVVCGPPGAVETNLTIGNDFRQTQDSRYIHE